jgi:hypothetical protein
MTTSLNIMSDREIRYTQRCLKKKIQQQNIDRSIRLEKRNTTSSNVTQRNDISNDVSMEIASISEKKSLGTRSSNSGVSFSSYFW